MLTSLFPTGGSNKNQGLEPSHGRDNPCGCPATVLSPCCTQHLLDLRYSGDGFGIALHGATLKCELCQARQIGFFHTDIMQMLGQVHLPDQVIDTLHSLLDGHLSTATRK